MSTLSMASIPPFCSSGGRSLVARNSFKVPLAPLNPKDPFLSMLASLAAKSPEKLLNRPINSDTTLMATPATVERSVSYNEHRLRRPPPDLPSLLLHGRIVYLGMPLVPAVTELLIIAELMYLQWMDPNAPIYLYINSTGTTRDDGESVGMETEGFAIYDAMMQLKNEIHTVGVEAAIGHACLLLATGTKSKRFMIPHAKAMIQQPRVPSSRLMTGIRAKENKSQHVDVVKEKSVSVVLLAGGQGKRMGASMPKQYLPLLGQPIALYSFYTFSRMSEVREIVVVCDPSYQDIFEDARDKINVTLKFALPGKERQDSVYSGLQTIDLNSELVCIHDSARPLVTSGDVEKVLNDGLRVGASVLGVPAKATIKEGNSESFVVKTLDRKTLWEMQTPQVIRPELLKKGFEHVNREGLEVTDDVSIVEHLKHPVYITEGSYTNIKVTTPDDLLLAERILNSASSVPA